MSIYLTLAVLLWGFSYIAIKESLEYLSPVELIAARLAAASVTLFIIIKAKRLSFSMRGQTVRLLITGGIVFVHFWIMATGMLYTTATNTAWILTTAPVFIAVLSLLVLKEKLGRGHLLGIVTATIGVLILVSRGNFTGLGWISSVGDWIVLTSCLTWAIYTIFTRKLTADINPLVVTFWTVTLAGIIIIPGSLFATGYEHYLTIPPRGIAAVLFLGIGCLAGAFWFWSEGLKRKTASEVGLYLYLEPLFATFGAWLLLHERIGWSVPIGGAFILAAVYFSEQFGREKRRLLK